MFRASGILVKAVLIVVLAHVPVDMILHRFGLDGGFAGEMLGALLLGLVSAPFLYLFVIRDIARPLSEREHLAQRAEEQDRHIRVLDEKRELGQRLLAVVNNVPGAVYRGHRDWSIAFIGAEVGKLTGYAPEEFADGAILWKDLIHPDDLARVKGSIRSAVEARSGVLQEEYRIRRKDGSIRWVVDRRQLIYGDDGDLSYVDGVLLDVTERKEIEERTRVSEYRYRAIVDTSPDGIVTVDSGGIVVSLNASAERLFGYAAAEVLGKDVVSLMPARYRDAHREGLERLRRGGAPRILGTAVELAGLRKDESEFPLELSVAGWGAREAPFYTAIIRDVTERRRWEDALRESEEKFRFIFDGSKDGILLADVDSRLFVSCNKAICEMLQYGCDELLELGIADIHPEEDVPRNLDLFGRMARGETDLANEVPVRRKDGSVFFADIKAGPVTISGKRCLIGNFRDVTGRMKAEEALNRLGLAVDQAAEAIVVTDTRGDIEYVNPAFERITGYSREEAAGRNLRFLKSGRHDEPFYRSMWETISRGEVWRGRFVNRRKDGTLYDEDSVISPVRDASGKIINFVAGKRDITREVVLQKQVQTAQRMESVGTLAGGIAHDFNNALTGILGYGELLRRRIAGDVEAHHDLDMIEKCAEQASTLTRQLLTFGRRQVIDLVNLDLNVVVSELLTLLRKVIGEQIEVRAFLSKHLPIARLDRAQIEQVVMNLCLNARDAMPSGGQLQVETAEVAVDEEYRELHPYMNPGRYALLSVTDTGIGMDDGTRERVFEPFFTTKPVDKGTGLGLAVVYGIVKQHNGFIHVYSEPGEGSTFKVYFPAVEGQPDALPEARREEPVRGGTETILLAEDEEAIRVLSERVLSDLGYTVLVARNGDEALDIFRRIPGIHLALLDVVMPRMGGKETSVEMRKANPAQKVIFMSGYSANAVHDSYVLAPDVHFLAKPFGPTSLARKVREVLDEE